MIRALALALALLAAPAAAQDYVDVPGLLSDEDFYRAVACGAPPGGDCQKPLVRWEASRPIRIALRRIDPVYLGRRQKVAEGAFKLGLRALNAIDAGFRLSQVPADATAEIEVYFLGIARGETIAGTGIAGIDGTPIGGASTRVLFNHETGYIERAVIVFSTTLTTAEFQPAMLEKLTQAMGLLTDIKSPAYDGVSVLAQESNGAKVLGLQDIMALKRHYAKD